jgi:6-phosphofructokinase 1
MEVYQDARVYDTGMITILEIMGRNAGWLTAASALASLKGMGPDLIYLPERVFDLDDFLSRVKEIHKKNKNVIAAVSEGIKDKDGRYISEYGSDLACSRDSFGHAQMGGLASTLANYAKEVTGAKVRGIEFSLLQRCAAHIASGMDIEEAFLAGQTAVKAAVEGKTDMMVAFERAPGKEYKCNIKLIELHEVANKEKTIPDEWITPDGTGVTQDFIDYALPLIQGTTSLPFENGLPRFAKLKKVLAKV